MGNVAITIEGNTAVIRIDLSQDLGPSSSGKTNIVASTYGNTPIPGTDIKVGVNAFRPRRS